MPIKYFLTTILLWSALLCGAAYANEQVITGTLHGIWGDPPPAVDAVPRQRSILTNDQGESIQLQIQETLVGAKGGMRALNGKRVSVRGRWGPQAVGRATTVFEVSGLDFVSAAGEAVSPISGPLVQGITGSKPWVTILCRFADSTATTPHPSTWFDTLMGASNPGMDHYWQELSYNNINLSGSTVVGWFNLPKTKAQYGIPSSANLGLMASDCAGVADSSVYFPSFSGINYMFNESIGCCAWGGSWWIPYDGGRSYSSTWMPPWGYGTHGVLAQEMGHGFGLPHSSGPYGATYDSSWDPMSDAFGYCPPRSQDPEYGCVGVHTIAYHKDFLGWIAPARKINVTGSQTITLERLGLPTNGTDYLMAQIPIGGSSTNFYTVEARRLSGGYDANIPDDAVIIHNVDTTLGDRNAQVVDDTNDGNPNDAGAMWTVGETFTDVANAITVAVIAGTGTGFTVTIVNGSVDTDGDGTPDITDTDDDNDGAPDTSEIANGTDPLNANDWPQPFADVVNTQAAYTSSLVLSDAEIVTGCGSGNFCPNQIVPRETVALWLIKAALTSSYTPPPFTQKYSDVTSASDFAATSISDMHTDNQGFSTGCDGGNTLYCPKQGFTKDQAAQMILRSKGYTSEPTCAEGVWNDVTSANTGCGWMEEMGNQSYAEGCGSGNYCPNALLTFAGFAKLLAAAYGLAP